MYLSTEAVLAAIKTLRSHVHPFIGITLVACKRHGLPIGATDAVSLDTITRAHMERHHRIDRRSTHYFQPFKGSATWWVAHKYPSSGLQTVNTQTFLPVFIHPRNTREWGLSPTYLNDTIDILRNRGISTEVAVDALAVWLFKDEDLGEAATYRDLVERFYTEYHIAEDEKTAIFSRWAMEQLVPAAVAFVSQPLEMTSVLRELEPPPDGETEGGRTITSMRLSNAGPARQMSIDFGQRLSLITGDNGLGKSFLLDFAWWAATGQWADKEALPQSSDDKGVAEVQYTLSTSSGRLSTFAAHFDPKRYTWVRPREAITVEALAVFSRADGSFAVADPLRDSFNNRPVSQGSMSSLEVWNGRPFVLEGLVRDWVRWENSPDKKAFDQFSTILRRLSPDDLGVLEPGPTVRLPGDPRDIPTVRHRYGSVPVTQASSGVQRVLLLAYLVIWSWQEHVLAATTLGRPPLRRMMVIVDELEAHLHPKWQRIVLPALMGVGDLLSSDLAIQMVAATHSPMILASMEATFQSSTDVLYHLYGDGPVVRLEETPFVKYGDASGWLTSPLFGLRHARSREAELAIEAAKGLQLEGDPAKEAVQAVSDRLRQHLAGDDKFWPRWLYFAEQHGVML